ncbi:MAG: hypothetical protein K9J12_13610 [Melioribacteraceae bacterium]|nr:hypothetical protein [Melioribacteraceae bacterium]MCF8263907.1 hypothetical protein [Melioribacteraceae bacterium]MCF8430312.1 hypothetical protein [Melioribacteraceae bacterium]
MTTIIIQHEIKNFEEWKSILDAAETNRSNAGVQLKGLYSSAASANDKTMI